MYDEIVRTTCTNMRNHLIVILVQTHLLNLLLVFILAKRKSFTFPPMNDT